MAVVGYCDICDMPFTSWGLPRECEHKRLRGGYKTIVTDEALQDQSQEFFQRNAERLLRKYAESLGIELGPPSFCWVDVTYDPNHYELGRRKWELRTSARETDDSMLVGSS